jgi:hypothetical protein
VPRDYRKAASLDRDACDDGCGDLRACDGLFELVIASRGAVPVLDDVGTLARMCNRGDAIGCAALRVVGLHGLIDTSAPQPGTCAGGDDSACAVDLWHPFDLLDDPYVHAIPDPPEVVVQHHRDSIAAELELGAGAMCRRGLDKACRSVIAYAVRLCDGRMGAGCVATASKRLRSWGIDPAPLAYAWTAVQRACDRGDADACALVPGHAVALSEVCDAGDYLACAELAAKGDDHAAAVGCAAGLTGLCTPRGPLAGAVQYVIDQARALAACTPGDTAGNCAIVEDWRAHATCLAPTTAPATATTARR